VVPELSPEGDTVTKMLAGVACAVVGVTLSQVPLLLVTAEAATFTPDPELLTTTVCDCGVTEPGVKLNVRDGGFELSVVVVPCPTFRITGTETLPAEELIVTKPTQVLPLAHPDAAALTVNVGDTAVFPEVGVAVIQDGKLETV